MREKLRSLRTTDPKFWAELCNDAASNVPKEGETIVEDEEVIEDDLVGDDSAVGIAEVIAEVLNPKEGGRVDGEPDGLVLSNFAEDDGEVSTNDPGPVMNILTSDPATTSSETVTTGSGERGKRKRTANKWYSMKNFIRHDDSDDDELEGSDADMYM
jgi:hypothetical protein